MSDESKRAPDLAAEVERLRKSERDNEAQLVRIAACIGKDARQAPDHDRTIAGAAIAEVERLREIARDAAECATRHQAEVLDLRRKVEALRDLWPVIEHAMAGLVFTGDKAGEVAAQMAAARAALASTEGGAK